MMEVKKSLKEKFTDIESIDDFDDIRLNFTDLTWIMISPSGTEAYIRVFTEHSNSNYNRDLSNYGIELINKIIRNLENK